MRFFAIFTISFFLSIPAFSQFPEYPFNRIQLGTQTESNKYLVVPTDSIPDWTPSDTNDAIMAFDTLGEIMYLFKSGAWEKFNPAFTDLSFIGTTGFQDFTDDEGVSSIVGGTGIDISSISGTPGAFTYTLVTDLSEFLTNSVADGNEELALISNEKLDIQTLLENVLVAGSNITITPSGDTALELSSSGGGSSLWTQSGSDIYYNSGKVGIDNSSPSELLDIGPGTTGNPTIRISESNGVLTLIQSSSVTSQINHENTSAGNAIIDINPIASDGTSNTLFRFFRKTNTTGDAYFAVLRGNNTSNPNIVLSGNGNSYINDDLGNVAIGHNTPSEQLHVVGNIRMENGSEATGSVVVSDANGTLDHTTTPESLAAFSGWDTDAGDDITNITVGPGMDVSGTTTKDITFDFSELESVSTVNGLDQFVMRTRYDNGGSLIATDARVNAQDLLANTLVAGSNITITQTGSGSTLTIAATGASGDITEVVAGDHLTGGGASGAVTLNVDEESVFAAVRSYDEYTAGVDVSSTLFVSNDTRIATLSFELSSNQTLTIPIPGFAPDGAEIHVYLDDNASAELTIDVDGSSSELWVFNNSTGNTFFSNTTTVSGGYWILRRVLNPTGTGWVWGIETE